MRSFMKTTIRKMIALTGFWLLAVGSVMAQEKKMVSGTVTDAATGQPLAGVIVEAYGNRSYTAMTDDKGAYELQVPTYVNSVSMRVEGYQLLQKSIGRNANLTNAQLYPNSFSPIYNATTQSASTRYADRFDNTARLSIDPLVAEQLGADIHSVSRSGQLGLGNTMFIGGLTSLQANAQPLVVIDGVITDMQYDRQMLHEGYFNNILANLNVNDIERVEVLKNGTAIYGAKAAGGVLLIKTKRNKSMATKIDVTINGQYQLQPRLPKMMGANDYRLYATEMLAGLTDNVQNLEFVNSDPTNFYYNTYHNNTDWTDEVYHNTFVSNYGINVQGGDDVANYNLSVGYSMGDATLRGNDFSRFNMRLNSDIKVFRGLDVRFDASYSDVNRDLRDDGAKQDLSVGTVTSLGFLTLIKSPFLAPYGFDINGNESSYLAAADDYLSKVFEADGSVYANSVRLPNPLGILKLGDGENRNQAGNRMVTFSVTPSYQFNRHLTLSEHFNFTLVNTNENYYLPLEGTPPFRLMTSSTSQVENMAQSMAARQNSIMSDTRLAWGNRYGAHKVDVFGGVRYQSSNYKLTAQRGFDTGNDKYPSTGNARNYRTTWGADDKTRDLTWYAQADYSWADKYYVEAGLSAETSSRFGDDADGLKLAGVVWGLFPSVNAAWVLTNERWLAGVKGIDYLRLNVGFDITGNDNIDYTASKTYFVANNMLSQKVDGLSIGNIGNTALKWETTSRLTAGLEGNFINNRLNVRFNYFKGWTKNLLTLRQLAWTSGLAENWSNDGKLENEGFEAGFGIKVLNLKDFTWELGASAGHYVNKITALPDNDKAFETNAYGATILSQVGTAAGVFYGYKTAGVYSTQAEADADKLYQVNDRDQREYFGAGDMRFIDKDGNGIINEEDRFVIGDPNPDIYGNIYTQLNWKHWSLGATMRYSLGNDVYNYQRSLLEGGSRFYNQTTALLTRWTTEKQVTDIPRISYGDPMGNSRFSDRWIEDGSYLRLSNVTLSYTIPIMSTYLQGITLWGAAYNLFTVTRYLGGDPDCGVSGNVLLQGIDRGLLASGRSIALGVKINL
jgi:TonB-linked SusC/RagA family outer membrane protein